MRRANPFGSPAGFVLTILLFAGLGIWLWRGRGLAFSPGAVSQKSASGVVLAGYRSHAEFEKQCRLCHEPLSSTMADKCVECHKNVTEQMSTSQGVHQGMDMAAGCHGCHFEHRGREYDPSLGAQPYFDHSNTSFSLVWHQLGYNAAPLECQSCHTAALTGGAADSACLACHEQADAAFMSTHVADAGSNCQSCHDGADRMRGFDHTSTGYVLQGEHATAACTGCHVDGQMVGITQACQDCHAEPAAHLALFSADCATCHTPSGWKPALLDGASFDHTTSTGFSLDRHAVDYQDNPLTCRACHGENVLASASLTNCLDCHTKNNAVFMQEHQAQFGSACLDCHDGVDRMRGFEHAQVFVLDGRHAEIECQDCHTDASGQPRFKDTPVACAGCHAEPQIHAGAFGLQCEYCHTAAGWSPANLRQHTFPLDHGVEEGSAPADCQTCHPADYVTYTCYGCHEHQPQEIEASHDQAGISRQELPVCAACHLNGETED
jgi:hypothetical protein